jgi:hypothetical protein
MDHDVQRVWYDEDDQEWGGNPAEEFQTVLNRGRADRHLSEFDLRDWRPEKRRGGRLPGSQRGRMTHV